MTCGIYEIWIGDYFYQGSSNNIERRISAHKHYLKKSCHDNNKMQNVYNKYKTFEYQILAECDEVALLNLEQDYIDANWGDEKYLNLAPSAWKPPGMKGRKCSDETKHKIAESRKGMKASDETKRKLSESHMGYKMPDEQKRKIAESLKRTKMSNEYKSTYFERSKNTKGYSFDKTRNKFITRINLDGKQKFVGFFEKEEDARQAYLAAREKYYGELLDPKT